MEMFFVNRNYKICQICPMTKKKRRMSAYFPVIFLMALVRGEMIFSPSRCQPFFVRLPQYGHWKALSGMDLPHFGHFILIPP